MRASPFPAFTAQRSLLVTLGFVVFCGVLAYEVADFIVSGNAIALSMVALVCIAAGIVLAILKNWRNGVYLFLTWLLFEDLARKFLGNNMAIYFAKDFLLLVVLFSFFAARRREGAEEKFRPPFLTPLLALVWFGVLQIFNFASTHIVYGLLGMKVYFFYIPLLFVGYSLLKSEADVRRFFFVNIGLALIIGVLGIIQSVLGHTFLNPAVAADDLRELSTLYRVSPITGALIYRPTSVFVSDGRYGYYLILAWIVTFGVSAYLLLRSRQGRTFATLSLGVLTVAVVLTGQRGALMWMLIGGVAASAAFFWGAPWRQQGVIRVLRVVQRAMLIGGLAIVGIFLSNPTALTSRLAFYSETLSLDSPRSELVYRVRDYPLRNFLVAFDYPRWPYGYGIGTTSLGIQYVARFFHATPPAGSTENGYGTIIVELGIAGFILWLVMSVSVVLSCWKVVRSLKGSPWFPLAFVILWYSFVLLFPMTYGSMVTYQNFVQNAYMWLLIGILFRLPKIALTPQFSDAGKTADAAPAMAR